MGWEIEYRRSGEVQGCTSRTASCGPNSRRWGSHCDGWGHCKCAKTARRGIGLIYSLSINNNIIQFDHPFIQCKTSFTNNAAAPIPLPTHMDVQRTGLFCRLSSASPVTTWRTPACGTMVINIKDPSKSISILTHSKGMAERDSPTAVGIEFGRYTWIWMLTSD